MSGNGKSLYDTIMDYVTLYCVILILMLYMLALCRSQCPKMMLGCSLLLNNSYNQEDEFELFSSFEEEFGSSDHVAIEMYCLNDPD